MYLNKITYTEKVSRYGIYTETSLRSSFSWRLFFPLHDSSLPYHQSSPEVRREWTGKNNRYEKEDLRLVSLSTAVYFSGLRRTSRTAMGFVRTEMDFAWTVGDFIGLRRMSSDCTGIASDFDGLGWTKDLDTWERNVMRVISHTTT